MRMKHLHKLVILLWTVFGLKLAAQSDLPPLSPDKQSTNQSMPVTTTASNGAPLGQSSPQGASNKVEASTATSPVSLALSPKPELEVRLSGTSLYEAIVKDASTRTDKAAEAREDKRWSTIYIAVAIATAIIAFFGWRSYADLKQTMLANLKDEVTKPEFFKRHLEDSVVNRVTDDVEKRIQSLSKELAFYRLTILASNLDQGTKFTDVERDAALNSLVELADEKNLTGRVEFENVLLKIIQAFAAADLNHQIEKITVLFPDVIDRSKNIIQILVQHFGMYVIGDSDTDESEFKKLGRYADVCHRLRMPGLAIPYQMVAEFKFQHGNWRQRIDGLFQDTLLMDESSIELVLKLLKEKQQPQLVAKKLTGQVFRFCRAFEEFCDNHKPRINELKSRLLALQQEELASNPADLQHVKPS
jgi:hypothetical protein